MSFAERVARAERDMKASIREVRLALVELEARLEQPLQDDWDDALHIGIRNVDEAVHHINSAKHTLRTY